MNDAEDCTEEEQLQLDRFLYEVDTAVANVQFTRNVRWPFTDFEEAWNRMFVYIVKTGKMDAVRVAYEGIMENRHEFLYSVGRITGGHGTLAVVQFVIKICQKEARENNEEGSFFFGMLKGAAERNNVEVITWLLLAYAAEYAAEDWKEDALRLAAKHNNFAIVDILLANGARDLDTALYDVASSSKCSIAMYEHLIARGASDFDLAVQGAAYAGSSQKVTFFVSKANGGVLDFDRALSAAVCGASDEVNYGSNYDCAHENEALAPWYDVISLLLRLGATDLNNALHCAARNSDGGNACLPMMKFLVGLGATDFAGAMLKIRIPDDEGFKYLARFVDRRAIRAIPKDNRLWWRGYYAKSASCIYDEMCLTNDQDMLGLQRLYCTKLPDDVVTFVVRPFLQQVQDAAV